MTVTNGPPPTLETRLAQIDAQIARAEAYYRRSCYQRHVEGRVDAIDAIKANRRGIADLERERDELQAALAEVDAMAQAATAREAALAELSERFATCKRIRTEGAQALKDGRPGDELWPTLQERDRELYALASVLAPVTNRPEHRASSLQPLVSLIGDELAESFGLVKRSLRGGLTAIRRPPPGPPRDWPWSNLVKIVRGEVPA